MDDIAQHPPAATAPSEAATPVAAEAHDGGRRSLAVAALGVVYGDIGTSPLAQGTSALTALVEIERWTKAAPEVQAFTPPMLARAG